MPDATSQSERAWPALSWGAGFWVLFCVMAVVVRGVRWDENYEFAQVLTGRIRYPAGHPLSVYVHGVFSGQTWLAALMMQCGAGAALLCGFRNVLFLLAAALPPFLFAAKLTGKNRWGHVAAFLTLEGVLLEFDGSYPVRIWPELYSNGQVGDGWALLTLFVLLAGGWRVSALLAGTLPAIHMGQVPGIGTLGALWLAGAWRRGEGASIRRAIPLGAGALAVCMVILLVADSQAPEMPQTGAYVVTGDPEPIWQAFVARADPHRRIPAGNSHVLLIGTILLAALAYKAEADPSRRRFYGGILLYTAVIATITWTTIATHALTLPSPPMLLLQWLPYRLANHAAPLLLAMAVSILANRRWTRPISVLLLVFALLRPYMSAFMSAEAWRAYLFNGEAVTFCLYGAALAALWQRESQTGSWNGLWALIAAIALAPYHQYGAACVSAGVIVGVCFWACRARIFAMAGGLAAVAVACLFSAGLMIENQRMHREHLARSESDRAVSRLLAEQAAPSAPLIAPLDTYALQARLDHPVLIDAATGSFLTYLPELAPAIQEMYGDVYGIRFDGPGAPVPWDQVWAGRDAAAWAALGRKYGSQYLLAPAGIAIQLPEAACVLRTESAVLYRIYEAP